MIRRRFTVAIPWELEFSLRSVWFGMPDLPTVDAMLFGAVQWQKASQGQLSLGRAKQAEVFLRHSERYFAAAAQLESYYANHPQAKTQALDQERDHDVQRERRRE